MIANDYKNLTAESTSSRFAALSSEEAFMTHTKSNKQTGILKWGEKKLMENKDFAYGDVEVYSVPVEGKIDQKKIQNALNKKFPRQSSYGSTRWFTGHAVLVKGDLGFKRSRFENAVTVEKHYAIAD